MTEKEVEKQGREIAEIYMKEFREGRIQRKTWYKLAYLGRKFGKNLPKVREILNLPLLLKKTKNGTVSQGPVAFEDIDKAIRTYWSQKDVDAFLNGEDITLKNLTSFSKNHEREYNAARKRHGGFGKVLESIYPSLYNQLSLRVLPNEIDEKELADIFIKRYYSGLPISYSALHNSKDREERMLVNKVLALSRRNSIIPRDERYVKTLAKLTNLPKEVIATPPRKTTQIGFLGEELTHFFLEWASLIGNLPDCFTNADIYSGRSNATKFIFLGDNKYSDLRIGDSQPIEVKTGYSKSTTSQKEFKIFLDKYSQGVWETSEPLENCVLVYHRRDTPDKSQLAEMNNRGMSFMGFSDFHPLFRETVEEIKLSYANEIEDIKPRIHSLDYIVELHEEVSLRTAVLMRSGIHDRLRYSRELARAFAKRAQELRNVS